MNRKSGTVALGAVFVVAAAIRVYVNDITDFAPADETVYLNYTRTLFHGGLGAYAQMVRAFMADQGMWLYPSPLRWAWLSATTLACRVAGTCTFDVLATLSTICGIAAVALTWLIAREWFDDDVALVSAALAVTSPLQLALGRRALADEFFCAVLLIATLAMLRYLRTNDKRWLVAWIVATTLTFAAKEQFLLIYPVLLLVWWLRTRRISWTWALPPILYAVVFTLLARDAMAFVRVWQLTTSTMGATFPEQYQNGPPQRLLIDYLAIAPIVTLLAVAAFARARREQRDVLVLAGGIMLLHSLLSSKNLRYVVSADPFIRIAVASFLITIQWGDRVTRLSGRTKATGEAPVPPLTMVLLIGNAVVELWLFNTVFVAGEVYDPVTLAILTALKMLPH